MRFVTNFNYTFGCFSKNRIDIYKNIIQSIEDYIITSEKLEVSFDAVRCALQWSPKFMVPDPNVTGRISWYPGMATAMSMMQVEIRPYYEAFH